MIRILLATILWLCLLPATAHAQPTLANLETISPVPLGEWDFEGGKLHFPETVFGSLPAAGTSGRIYIVTDATTSSDCTAGGGTSRALCRDTGAIWESIGGGGGGGSGNSFVTWDMPVGTDPVADSSSDTITFVCPPPMVCAGNSSTDTLTLSVTTPTPTLSATPTVTVTTTAFACDPGFALDQAHPEGCIELPTPDGGANYPTPTVVESVTPTPVVCQTNAAYGLGGLFKANPEACQAVGPTLTPTATPSVTPTGTVTSAPTPTTTAVNCPTAYGGLLGGLFGAHPEQCQPLVTPTATATATASPTPTATDAPSPTRTPVTCRTATVYGAQVGGLYKVNPDECVATPAPTATLGVTPTYTVPFATPTVNLSATPTAVLCATAGAYGGLYGDNPLLCQAIVATPTSTPPVIIGQTSTSTATPTATSATATATAVTPTATATPVANLIVGGKISLHGYLDCLLTTGSTGAVTCLSSAAQVSLLGQTIEGTEVSAPFTWPPGTINDGGADTLAAPWDVPRKTDCTTITSEGRICWDTTRDVLGLGSSTVRREMVMVDNRGNVGPSATPTTSPTSATATPTTTPTTSPTLTATNVATATPTGATATPTPAPSPTVVFSIQGQPINGCVTVGIGGQTLAPEFVGMSSGGSGTQGAAFAIARVPTEIRNIVCGFQNDVGWGKTFAAEIEIAPLSSCIPASDNAASACIWAAPAGGVRCDIKGTLATNEIGCGANLDLYPTSNYRAGPTYVPYGYAYHFVTRNSGITGSWNCSWDVCPLGALK